MGKTFFMSKVGKKRKRPEPKTFRQVGVTLIKRDPAKDKPTQVRRETVEGKHIIVATHWTDTKSHEQEAADISGEKRELIKKQVAKGEPFHPRINPESRVKWDTTDVGVFKDER